MAGAALAMTAGAVLPATAADAHRTGCRHTHGRQYAGDDRQYRDYRGDNSYRAQQKCADGDGGTIVGALAGRAIDRSDRPGYCR